MDRLNEKIINESFNKQEKVCDKKGMTDRREKRHAILFDDSTLIWKWKCRRRNWGKELVNGHSNGVEVLVDPLRANTRRLSHARFIDTRQQSHQLLNRSKIISPEVTGQTIGDMEKAKNEINGGTMPEFIDPLGAYREEQSETNSITKIDPLSVPCDKAEPQLANTLAIKEEEYLSKETILPGFKPWSTHRRKILQEFTTNEKLSITSSFLPNGVPLNTKIVIADRAAHRLEQLNDTSGLKKLADLSQEEYIRNVNELRKRLLIAWANEKKVESVQIIVELSRILSSTAAPQFYPSQFVLVTDILDIFGDLVYQRLLNKANKERSEVSPAGSNPLPKHFTHTDVPLTTRETAKNWFCKIQEILELLPRFYVEASIIGCIRFLDTDSLSANLHRLCGMTLSIEHPLIASYARSYICRVAMRLSPADRAPHWKCLNDWMQSFETQPTALLLPAMEWIVQCVSYNAVSYNDLLPLWEYCRMPIKRSIILRPFLRSIPVSYLCEHALEACKVVITSEEITAQELCVFGEQLLKGNISEEAKRPILRNIWRNISKLSSLRGYMQSSVVWIEFAARYFTVNEISVMLDCIVKKITPDRKYENFYESLLSIVDKLLTDRIDISQLFAIQQFPSLIDLFRNNSASHQKCASALLSAFVRQHPMRSSNNFQFANQILQLCKVMHDSLSTSSTDQEIGMVSLLIERSLDRFDFNSDPERALDFFVDCRAALSNIDSLVAWCVSRVCALGYSLVNRRSKSRSVSSFIRALIANSFITIASLSNPLHKLQLYLQTALITLLVNSLPQMDAIMKCCIEVLASCQIVPVQEYRKMASSFLAFLIFVPDSPKRAPLYMFNAFMNATARYPWGDEVVERARLFIDCLRYLSTVSQPELPYHIGNSQSNDTIYGNSAAFLDVIDEKCDTVIGQLEELYNGDTSRSVILAMELLEFIVDFGDVKVLKGLICKLYERCATSKDETTFKRRRCIFERLQKLSSNDASFAVAFGNVNQT